jgi:hypothetical protein
LAWQVNLATYRELILRCQYELLQGETYEVCLTNQLIGEGRIQPLEVYRVLRKHNPAPYAAYLRIGGYAVLCASPELFLRISGDREVESKPIKGTAARGTTPAEDDAIADAMVADEKTRAENLMIVDLLRNDLNRVCEIDSVHVPSLFAVETYATVHQLVSTIRGKLRADLGTIDCVRAAFPGGSMTGAPKVHLFGQHRLSVAQWRGPAQHRDPHAGIGQRPDLHRCWRCHRRHVRSRCRSRGDRAEGTGAVGCSQALRCAARHAARHGRGCKCRWRFGAPGAAIRPYGSAHHPDAAIVRQWLAHRPIAGGSCSCWWPWAATSSTMSS